MNIIIPINYIIKFDFTNLFCRKHQNKLNSNKNWIEQNDLIVRLFNSYPEFEFWPLEDFINRNILFIKCLNISYINPSPI